MKSGRIYVNSKKLPLFSFWTSDSKVEFFFIDGLVRRTSVIMNVL